MKRKEEYLELVQELEKSAPDMQSFIGKAKRKNAWKQCVFKPLAGLAASFAVFAVTVNFCAPVATVCAQVPVLKELLKVVAFSPSLRAAVENNYVQQIGKTVTDGDVTAHIDYMIVDDTAVNVFYTLSSDRYNLLNAVTSIVGDEQQNLFTTDSWEKVDGEDIQHCEIMAIEGDIPNELTLHLDVYQNLYREEVVHREREHEYIASMDVTLEFDSVFRGNKTTYAIDQQIDLDGKKFTMTDVEVDATRVSIELEADKANTAWLTRLDYYIVTDKGDKFYSSESGLTAHIIMEEDGEGSVCFYAESPYFSDAESLELVIQGASWLEKGQEQIKMNLVTGETEVPLPENVSIESIKCVGDDNWYISSKAKLNTSKPLQSCFTSYGYDEDGNKYIMFEDFDTCEAVENMQEKEKAIGVYPIRYGLEDYPYEEVYLGMNYTELWDAEEEIVLKIK